MRFRQFDRLEMVGMANRWMRFIFVVLEIVLNQIGLTMLLGDKMIRLYAIIFIVALLGGAPSIITIHTQLLHNCVRTTQS